MFKIGDIIQTLKGIVEARLELVKQDIQEQFIGIVFRLLLLIFMFLVGLMVLLFLSFSLAFYLSQYTNSAYMGFLLVGGIYFVIMAIIYFTRHSESIQRYAETALRGFIFNKKKN